MNMVAFKNKRIGTSNLEESVEQSKEDQTEAQNDHKVKDCGCHGIAYFECEDRIKHV